MGSTAPAIPATCSPALCRWFGTSRAGTNQSRLTPRPAGSIHVSTTSYKLQLAPEPINVSRARHFATDHAKALGLTDTVDVVELLVGEVVTNTILHAATQVTRCGCHTTTGCYASRSATGHEPSGDSATTTPRPRPDADLCSSRRSRRTGASISMTTAKRSGSRCRWRRRADDVTGQLHAPPPRRCSRPARVLTRQPATPPGLPASVPPPSRSVRPTTMSCATSLILS